MKTISTTTYITKTDRNGNRYSVSCVESLTNTPTQGASHWFFASPRKDSPHGLPGGFQIETFGTGKHPRSVYWYATEPEWKRAIRAFKRAGYEERCA